MIKHGQVYERMGVQVVVLDVANVGQLDEMIVYVFSDRRVFALKTADFKDRFKKIKGYVYE